MDFLPAAFLPNIKNSSDSQVLLQTGETISASQFIQMLGDAEELRFMVTGEHTHTSKNPQFTQEKVGSRTIISASFLFLLDDHHRKASAAVVWDFDKTRTLGEAKIWGHFPQDSKDNLIDAAHRFYENTVSKKKIQIRVLIFSLIFLLTIILLYAVKVKLT